MPPGQTAPSWMQFPFIPYLLIIGIFYFLVWKPQKEKQNKTKDMLANLKKNDQVVTSGGIHATVLNVKETTVVVRIDDNTKMEVDKEAIVKVTRTTENKKEGSS